MKNLQKLASVIAMVISTLLFIVILAGIMGAWWGQGRLRGTVTQIGAAGDRGLVDVQAAVIQVNDAVQKRMARLHPRKLPRADALTPVEAAAAGSAGA